MKGAYSEYLTFSCATDLESTNNPKKGTENLCNEANPVERSS